jgi:hypothetical protein
MGNDFSDWLVLVVFVHAAAVPFRGIAFQVPDAHGVLKIQSVKPLGLTVTGRRPLIRQSRVVESDS